MLRYSLYFSFYVSLLYSSAVHGIQNAHPVHCSIVRSTLLILNTVQYIPILALNYGTLLQLNALRMVY